MPYEKGEIFIARTTLERFWKKTKRGKKPDDCWPWQGAIDPKTGYPRFRDGFTTYAHRWSYRQFVGEIPDGLELDHTCNFRRCVNPKHLEPVTHQENKRRGLFRREKCVNGHTGSRYIIRDGRHICRECNTLRQRRFQEKIAEGHQTPQLTREKCKRNHVLDERNAYKNKSGYVGCRACAALKKRELRKRKKVQQSETV